MQKPLSKSSPYLLIVVMYLFLWLGCDFNGLYGQDAHEYLRYANAISTSQPLGDFYWPKLYPFLGALLSYTGLSVKVSMQLISLLAILGCLYFLQRSIRFLYDESGTWIMLLGAATQVYFVRAGLLVMTDALAAFFVIGFVYYYLRVLRKWNFKDFIWICLFAVAGIFTRYAVIPLLAIPLIHAAWIFTQKWNILFRLGVGLTVIVTGCLILFWNSNAIDLISAISREWHPMHLVQNSFFYESHQESYWVPNGIYIWSNFGHLGYLSCGALLLFWYRRWNYKLSFLWIGLLLYLVFIGGIGFQNQRFMVISHLIVLILVYPAFQSLLNWLKQRQLKWIFLSGTLALNGAFFYYSFSKMFALHRFEKLVAEKALPLEDDKPIYAFYVTPSLGSYNIPNERIDLWEEKIVFQKGGYVIFNPTQFEDNTRVMKNWERVNRDFELEIIDELPQNWNIYRIQ